MLVRAYGLFWYRDQITWSPGRGNSFLMLGRQGKNNPNLKVANFRYQPGIYVLYGNYGAYYVGLTKEMGRRLRDHTTDEHANNWDKFSWFGFSEVLKGKDENGMRLIKKVPDLAAVNTNKIIDETETLLIHVLNTVNVNKKYFKKAGKWEQIKPPEILKYLEKIS